MYSRTVEFIAPNNLSDFGRFIGTFVAKRMKLQFLSDNSYSASAILNKSDIGLYYTDMNELDFLSANKWANQSTLNSFIKHKQLDFNFSDQIKM